MLLRAGAEAARCPAARPRSKTGCPRHSRIPAFPALAKAVIVAIGGIGQHHATRHILVRAANGSVPVQSQAWSGTGLLRHACFPASFRDRWPRPRADTTGSRRKTGLRGGQRHADRYLAVLLLAQLPAVLPRDAHRMACPSWESPCHRRSRPPPGPSASSRAAPDGVLPSAALIAPRRIGHDVMQRLMHPSHVVRGQTRRHRLDALALTGQQQALGVILDGNHAIRVPGSFRQTLQVDRRRSDGRERSGWRLFIALNVLPVYISARKIRTEVSTL